MIVHLTGNFTGSQEELEMLTNWMHVTGILLIIFLVAGLIIGWYAHKSSIASK